jgi:hypothetical protein
MFHSNVQKSLRNLFLYSCICPNYKPFFVVHVVSNCDFNIAPNEKVFMKKGEFGTRPPVAGAGFCSKVELLPTAS